MNKKTIAKLLSISIHKTLIFNFRYFYFRTAIKIPVLINRNVILKNLGGKVILNTKIESKKINIGFDNVGTFDIKRSKTIWEVKGKVIFNGSALIGQGSKISVGTEGVLEIGDEFVITAETAIIALKRIAIGNNCLLSWDILIMDTDFHEIIMKDKVINMPKEIHIGNNVWIGCRTTILKGSIINDGCIIGSNSVVTGELSKINSIYAGN